ncbi:hypothetical protein ABBQ38_008383 [Trebouxia sp. C0009 RCD-2024]
MFGVYLVTQAAPLMAENRWGAAKHGAILVLELGMGSHGAQPVQMAVISHLYRSEVLQPDPHAAMLPVESHHHMPYTPTATAARLFKQVCLCSTHRLQHGASAGSNADAMSEAPFV